MKITNEALEDMLKCFDPKDIPEDREVARQALENFMDLLKVIMRPVPLPPGGSAPREAASVVPITDARCALATVDQALQRYR